MAQEASLPPRLRVPRLARATPSLDSASLRPHNTDTSPQDEDNDSTPRRSLVSPPHSPRSAVRSQSSITDESLKPAERLRAILVKHPRSSPEATMPPSPSEHESDFEPPELSVPELSSQSQPFARESVVRSLFEHATRDDTPVKDRSLRPRRNSIGSASGGIDDSPIKRKVKRQSLSDEEVDNSAARSSAIPLRSRFLTSKVASGNETSGLEQASQRTADMELSGGSKPMSLTMQSIPGRTSPRLATSTLSSLRQSESQLPSQYSGSNLLNGYSFQRYMKENENTDLFVDESIPRRSISTTPQPQAGPSTLRLDRPPNSPSTVKVNPSDRKILRRQQSRESISSSSSHTSSSPGIKDRTTEHNRERAWNRPASLSQSRTPSSHKNIHILDRKPSASSLNESNGVANRSRAGSTSSQDSVNRADAPQRRLDKGKAREIGSPLQHQKDISRQRTMSQPTRPSSSLTRLQSDQAETSRPASALARHQSSPANHVSSHSHRTNSPTSSIASNDSLQEYDHERQHERERNWNSAHPVWEHDPIMAEAQRQQSRSVSPALSNQEHHRHDSRRNTTHWDKGSVEDAEPLQISAEENSFGRSLEAHSTPNGTNARTQRPFSLSESFSQARISPIQRPSLSSVSRHTSSRSTSSLPQLKTRNSRERVSSPSPLPELRPGSRSSNNSSHSLIPTRRKLDGADSNLHGSKGHTRSSAASNDTFKKMSFETSRSTSLASNGLQNHDDPERDELPHPKISLFQQTLRSVPMAVPAQLSSPPATPAEEGAQTFAGPDPGYSANAVESRPETLPAVQTPQTRMTYSKLQFKTPSPPHNMPALPDPPTDDDDEDTDRTPTTPLRALNGKGVADMKTPRPPGGWATPAVTRAQSMPLDESSLVQSMQTPYTPPASLSKATSLPLQTPAPPGAYAATPSTIRRKTLQKVRFDDPNFQSDDNTTEPQELPPTPPRPSPRSPRRTSGIRILDAFGKVIPPGASPEPVTGRGTSVSSKKPDENTPSQSATRRREPIRILDAMGRPIAENTETETELDDIDDKSGGKLDPQQAKALLRQTVVSLKNDFIEFERESAAVVGNDMRLADLQEQSRNARDVRTKIREQLRNVSGLSNLHFSKSTLPGISRPSVRSTLFWILVQSIFAFAMWRLSYAYARVLFVTRYHDPYSPTLYLRLSPSQLIGVPLSPVLSRGEAGVHATSSDGWLGAMENFWFYCVNALRSLGGSGFAEFSTEQLSSGTTWTPS